MPFFKTNNYIFFIFQIYEKGLLKSKPPPKKRSRPKFKKILLKKLP